MNIRLTNLFCSFCFLTSIFYKANNIGYSQSFESQNQGVYFTENNGRVSNQNHKPRPDVLFGGSASSFVFHLRNNGLSYQFSRVDVWKYQEDCKIKEKRKIADQISIYRLDINWLNCNASSKVKKEHALSGYSNYNMEVCPNGLSNVKSYRQVIYQSIYKGIDLKWCQKDGNLKHDYIISPGADYKQIQLEIKGAENIGLTNKVELIIKTPFGSIIEKAPLVKQNGNILTLAEIFMEI